MAAPEDDEKPASETNAEPARSEAKTEAFQTPDAPARDSQQTEAVTVPKSEAKPEAFAAAQGRSEPLPVLPGARKEPRLDDDEPRSDVSEVSDVGYYRAHPSRNGLIVALVGATLGFIFACVSTSDFMQHLDRQVHAIHCSFIPGAGKEMGDSGCRTVMMSPVQLVLPRERVGRRAGQPLGARGVRLPRLPRGAAALAQEARPRRDDLPRRRDAVCR